MVLSGLAPLERSVSLLAKLMNAGLGASWITETCPECGQALNSAIYYEGKSSNIKGHLLWCSNVACSQVGINLDPATLKPKVIP